jgi:HD superfamily phosphohydrolase
MELLSFKYQFVLFLSEFHLPVDKRGFILLINCNIKGKQGKPLDRFMTNKSKIINDPVYGFIKIRFELVFDLMQHPFIQRLRNIKQLGLTNFVYPGATHTRFQHALGALHLMDEAIQTLRSKGITISQEEEEAALAAILLHDIGHGPFSHALESSIIVGIDHEDLSSLMMEQLNDEFDGKLQLAIRIFHDRYRKGFLHQLVSSQLDMDRLDYLRRDSFFSGVIEGAIGSDRIIKMLHVVNDRLVVEAKGIYSIEKFLIARRLMFWQVYLHKTVISAEQLLVRLLKRARQLAQQGKEIFATPVLHYFLQMNLGKDSLKGWADDKRKDLVYNFSLLDDSDIMSAAKVWTDHPDPILYRLSRQLLSRSLFAVEIQNQPFPEELMEQLRRKVSSSYHISLHDTGFFVFSDSISNHIYDISDDKIQILFRNGKRSDISEVSDMINISALSKPVKKYYLCFPKEFRNILHNYL